jgi:hypothetical protein
MALMKRKVVRNHQRGCASGGAPRPRDPTQRFTDTTSPRRTKGVQNVKTAGIRRT